MSTYPLSVDASGHVRVRRCERCGARLRSTNPDEICSPCQGAAAFEESAAVVVALPAEPTAAERASARRERIVELCGQRAQSAGSLATILDFSHRCVRCDLDRLEAEGRVEVVAVEAQRRLYRTVEGAE